MHLDAIISLIFKKKKKKRGGIKQKGKQGGKEGGEAVPERGTKELYRAMKTFYTSQETDVIMLMSVFINTHLIIP